MGTHRIIAISLQSDSNSNELIKEVTTHALTLGFHMYDPLRIKSSKALSPKAALANFIQPTEETLDDGGPTIPTVYKDTHFLFHIKKKHAGMVNIAILPSSNIWKKEIEGKDTYVDFARYLDLLMQLTNPYPIVDVNIDTL